MSLDADSIRSYLRLLHKQLYTRKFKLGVGILLILFSCYFIFNYCQLLTRVITFHIIKYSILSFISLYASNYVQVKYYLNRRGYYILIIVVSSLVIFDTLTWCDFFRTELFSKDQPRFFIAGNLYNNENIFDVYSYELERFIQLVGRDNVFISIVEDHSTDNTPILLEGWSKKLKLMGVEHKIITKYSIPDKTHAGRIQRLAYLRNAALQPFFETEAGFIDPTTLNSHYDNTTKWEPPKLLNNISPNSRIIFLNDITFFKENLVTLLNTNGGEYTAACSTDYDFHRLYDTWVVRDSQGHQLNPYYPFFHNPEDKKIWINNEPVEVYSCWNGMVVFDPEVVAKYFSPQLLLNNTFSSTNTTPVEPNLPGIRFRVQSAPTECFASECFYIWYDLRHRATESLKIFLNPNVKVSYGFVEYIKGRELLSWYVIRTFYRLFFWGNFGRDLSSHRDMEEYDCWKYY